MKKSHILYIIFAIIAAFFIGKTIADSIFKKELTCVEYKRTINDLNDQLEEKQKVIDSLQINNWLLEDYYCSSENLLDTIFHHYIIDGVFVFEYEPYTKCIDNMWLNHEDFYNYLENRRNEY